MEEQTPEERLAMYEAGRTHAELCALDARYKKCIVEKIIGRPLSVLYLDIHDPIACARCIIKSDKRPLPDKNEREPTWVYSEQFFHNQKRTARRTR